MTDASNRCRLCNVAPNTNMPVCERDTRNRRADTGSDADDGAVSFESESESELDVAGDCDAAPLWALAAAEDELDLRRFVGAAATAPPAAAVVMASFCSSIP